jgi:diguanylate cyclase (GGDEF)-like protein
MTLNQGTNVLIVEDDTDQRYFLSRILSNVPHHVYLVSMATTLKEAVQSLARQQPQAMLLDLNLPDSQALATLYYMRKHYPNVAIIVITAIDDYDVEYKAMKEGIQEYLVKGQYSKGELLRSVDHALERKRQILEIDNKQKELAEVLHKIRAGNVDAVISSKTPSGSMRIQDAGLVAENEALLEKLEMLANRDTLSKLPNRLYFENNLAVSLRHAARYKQSFAILFIDIDHFKVINDNYGHDAGDRLLKAVSKRMSDCIREGDMLARFGGDEFGLILPQANGERAGRVAKKVNDSYMRPFNLGRQQVRVTVSIGIAVYPDGGENAADLMKHADVALYRVKHSGRNGFQHFKQDIDKAHKRLLCIENELHAAIENQEFSLVYQPIITLSSRRVIAFEALLRWHSPSLGDVCPCEFIPIAESLGIVFDLTRWVINQGCRQLQDWRDNHHFNGMLAINITSSDISRREFTKYILATLKRFNLPASSVQIEITESTIMKNEGLAGKTLEALHDAGIAIAIDDFGTGYSSFNRINKLPISAIKIDRSFIKSIVVDEVANKTVNSMLSLARVLSLDVIAYGIESEEVVLCLQGLGCDCGQGIFFGEPLAAGDVVHYLQTRKIAQSREVSSAILEKECLSIREVGHNINNTLAGVLGYSELFLEGEQENEVRDLLMIIRETSKAMMLLTRQLSVYVIDLQSKKKSLDPFEFKSMLMQCAAEVSGNLRCLLDDLSVSVKNFRAIDDSDEDASRFQKRLSELVVKLHIQYKELCGHHLKNIRY